MTLRLLDWPSSPFSSRCRIVLYAKDADQVEIIGPPGDLFSDEYKAFHPFVKIPTLDLGTGPEGMLLESDVICDYLDDVLDGPALTPTDAYERARMRLIRNVADAGVMAPMMPLFKQLDPAVRDDEVVAREIDAMMLGYDKLNYYLSGAPYAVGDSLSLADCTLVPSLLLTERFLPRFDKESPLRSRSNVRSYWEGIANDPHAARVMKEMHDKLNTYGKKKD